jgi:hypothetical protein
MCGCTSKDSLTVRRVYVVREGATELIHIGQAVFNLKGTDHRLFHREYVQLPDARGGLQDRRACRLESTFERVTARLAKGEPHPGSGYSRIAAERQRQAGAFAPRFETASMIFLVTKTGMPPARK